MRWRELERLAGVWWAPWRLVTVLAVLVVALGRVGCWLARGLNGRWLLPGVVVLVVQMVASVMCKGVKDERLLVVLPLK
jgi:hypothetical protein